MSNSSIYVESLENVDWNIIIVFYFRYIKYAKIRLIKKVKDLQNLYLTALQFGIHILREVWYVFSKTCFFPSDRFIVYFHLILWSHFPRIHVVFFFSFNFVCHIYFRSQVLGKSKEDIAKQQKAWYWFF